MDNRHMHNMDNRSHLCKHLPFLHRLVPVRYLGHCHRQEILGDQLLLLGRHLWLEQQAASEEEAIQTLSTMLLVYPNGVGPMLGLWRLAWFPSCGNST